MDGKLAQSNCSVLIDELDMKIKRAAPHRSNHQRDEQFDT
jgi:hypothetical protein